MFPESSQWFLEGFWEQPEQEPFQKVSGAKGELLDVRDFGGSSENIWESQKDPGELLS